MKIAINGFGRIGRSLFVLAKEYGYEIIYVNDLLSYEQANYLLKYDSIYGNSNLNLDNVIYTTIQDNKNLDFNQADIILEATGVFTLYCENEHYNKKVIICSPSKDILKSNIFGVNENFTSNIISSSSCTATAIAPIIHLLEKEVTIKKVNITVVHSYTSGQSLLDGAKKNDKRVARSATTNIIPLLSSVAGELKKNYPNIDFAGVNIRVPVAIGMFLYLTIEVDKIEDKHKLEQLVKSQDNDIIFYSNEPLFSSRAKDIAQSCIINEFTISDDTLLAFTLMQDNERAYARRVLDLVEIFTKR